MILYINHDTVYRPCAQQLACSPVTTVGAACSNQKKARLRKAKGLSVLTRARKGVASVKLKVLRIFNAQSAANI